MGKSKNDVRVMSEFNKIIESGIGSQKAFSVALKNTGLSIKDVSSYATNLMKSSENCSVSIDGYTASLRRMSAASIASSIALKALTFALNAGASYLAGVAISWLDGQIHAQEKLEDKLSDLQAEYQNSTEKLTSLNSELAETRRLIDEINNNGISSIIEQERLDELKEVEQSLLRQIELENKLNALKNREAQQGVVDVLQNKYSDMYQKHNPIAWTLHVGSGGVIDLSYENYISTQIQNLNALKTIEQQAWEAFYSAENEPVDVQKELLEKATSATDRVSETLQIISDARQYLKDQFGDLSRIENPTEEWMIEYNKFFDLISYYEDAIINSDSGKLTAQFNKIKRDFSDSLLKVQDYIDQNGEIDLSQLNVIAPDVKNAFEVYGWNAEDIIQLLNNEYFSASSNTPTPDLEPLLEGYESIRASMEASKPALDALTAALEEQASAGQLTAATYENLVGLDSNYANFLEKTASGYMLNTDAVYDYLEAQNQLEKGLAIARVMELQELMADSTLSDETKSAYDAEINKLQVLIGELDSATGAYERYMQARNTANQDAMYQTGTTMYKEFDEAYKAGKTGTDDFQASVAFALGEDWENKYKDREEAYKEARAVLKKYFGGDDEKANATNFLNELIDEGFMEEDGQLKDGTTIESIAAKLDTSKDMVRSLFGLLETYELVPEGFTFETDESDKALAQKAQEVKALQDKAAQLDTEIASVQQQIESAETSGTGEADIQLLQDKLTELESMKAEIERLIAESGMGGTASSEGALTVDEALDRLNSLMEIKNSLAVDGIEIPITLGGEWEKLSWFLGANGISIRDPNKSYVSNPFSNNASESSQIFPEPIDAPVEFVVSEESIQKVRNLITGEPMEVSVVAQEPDPTSSPIVRKPDWRDALSQIDLGEPVDFGFEIDMDSVQQQVSDIEENLVFEAQLQFSDGLAETFDVQSISAPLSKAANEAVQQVQQASNASPELLNAASDVKAASMEVFGAVVSFNSAENMSAEDMQTAAQNVLTSCSNLATAYQNLQGLMSSSGMVTITANTTPAQQAIDKLKQTVTVTVKTVSVPGNAKGTKHAKAGASLVDEEGAELIEHRKTGTYELGTNNGARLTNLEAGDVVHTAEETKKILGRKASVGGAFASGVSSFNILDALKKLNATSSSSTKSSSSASNKTSGSSSSSSSSKKTSTTSSKKNSSSKMKKYLESLEKLFDWIEVRFERLQQVTDDWVRSASEAVGYVVKNASLDNALTNIAKQINESNLAYDKYMAQANDVAKNLNISASVIKKVQDGTININSYSEDARKRIEAYQEWLAS